MLVTASRRTFLATGSRVIVNAEGRLLAYRLGNDARTLVV